jgi:hypothetical protein
VLSIIVVARISRALQMSPELFQQAYLLELREQFHQTWSTQ